jgi:secreted PhoX family phosphatase
MGRFDHEAVAVDPAGKALYLTEDALDGAFYRFKPSSYPDLSSGTLEVLTESGGSVSWSQVPDPSGASGKTSKQVPGTKVFAGGEGICFWDGSLFFTTKIDGRVWQYTPASNSLSVLYEPSTSKNPILSGVDNITVAGNGDFYVAEDGGDMQLVHLVGADPAAVVQVVGADGSEVCGPAFSPDGTRLYFSSQRPGITYEVRGPWRH